MTKRLYVRLYSVESSIVVALAAIWDALGTMIHYKL